MSRWTHITACLSVDTCIESRHLISTVKKYINNAPKITGSEGDADVFVNIQSGHNFYTSCDCEHCKYKNTIERLPDKKGFSCEHPEDYECPEGEYQTCIVISIQGDLRDKDGESTKEEFINFLDYIEERYIVRDYSINIEDECEDESITKI